MAKSTDTLVEWGAIIIFALFVLPRVLASLNASNARNAILTQPGAALSAQEARAVNTAGAQLSNALGNALAKLLGNQQQQAKPPGGGAPGGGSAGMLPQQKFPIIRPVPPAPSLAGLTDTRNLSNLWAVDDKAVVPPPPDVTGITGTPDMGNVWGVDGSSVVPPPPDWQGLPDDAGGSAAWDSIWAVDNQNVVPPPPDLTGAYGDSDPYAGWDWSNMVAPPDAGGDGSGDNSIWYDQGTGSGY